jgi:putative Mg2+ transporter-C (MgtC) family protein
MGQYILRLVIAGIVGFIVGITSCKGEKNQSSRDFALISIGAALTTIIGLGLYSSMGIPQVGDPARIPAQILSALGFLGTGMIWVNEDKTVRGITGAAALWLTAILGMMIGAGLNQISVLGVLFFIFIYWLSHRLQGRIDMIRRFIFEHRGKNPHKL